MVVHEKNNYPERTEALRKKIAQWCSKRNLGLYAFLKTTDVRPPQYYRLIQGNMPQFCTVYRLIRSTQGFLNYKDFEEAVMDKEIDSKEEII